ncbi:hypothetical protein ATCV1_Z692L [Acanthocystis turfacea chlorella virus 1]|uniref:Uncharacterized protein Z692L n=1 Tax=Chlorovirus heliozoae TaxID=322019 RepID=A7K9V2_9PHYC|nr:hypothetical protein ATCV1_Z692L [Acanthocystis turfacea chlorella virus 1]ABT16826.1 hypothetical protein ATCV1_Z692L [Acanthocystis turfacea chlorella virus 1]
MTACCQVDDKYEHVTTIFTMTTLEYDWSDGTHTTFSGYVIDESGVVTNAQTGQVMTRRETVDGYNTVSLLHERKLRLVRVARALASTFLGPPITLLHTVDHIDKNSFNDILTNIRWASTNEQINNRKMPTEFKSAFVIVKDGVENTAKCWVNELKNETNRLGRKYTVDVIQHYARQKLYGFQYKEFPNLRGEVWKLIPWSRNSQGEWLISNMSRMKYKTTHAESVLYSEKLLKSGGYPAVKINGKYWSCHELSLMMFRPNEYAARIPGDIILHKNDDKLDFGPFRLRFGSQSENGIDAHKNGKFDNTKTSRKPVISYISNVLEKEHESIAAAVIYLRDFGYPKAATSAIGRAIHKRYVAYDRMWEVV